MVYRLRFSEVIVSHQSPRSYRVRNWIKMIIISECNYLTRDELNDVNQLDPTDLPDYSGLNSCQNVWKVETCGVWQAAARSYGTGS